MPGAEAVKQQLGPLFQYGLPTSKLVAVAVLVMVVIAAVFAAGQAFVFRSSDPVDGLYWGTASHVLDDDGDWTGEYFRIVLWVSDGSITAASLIVDLNQVRRVENVDFDPALPVDRGRFEFHAAAAIEGRFFGDGARVEGTWEAGPHAGTWEAHRTDQSSLP